MKYDLKNIIQFHFNCRYLNNPFVTNNAYYEIERRFLEKKFEIIEIFREDEIKAFIGLAQGNYNSQWKLYVDYDINSENAKNWTLNQLDKIVNEYDKLFSEVFYQYESVINYFDDNNFKLRRILTLGSFINFREGVKRHFPLNIINTSPQLTIRKLKNLEIGNVSELLREEFSKNPQHGPSHDGFINNFEEMLERDLKGEHCQFVFEGQNKEILGHFAAFIDDDKIWGKVAGLHFMLHKSIQREKLLGNMYCVLVNELMKFSPQIITGSTTHPAVLKNLKKLGRRPFFYSFDKNEDLYNLSEVQKYLN